MCMSTSFPCGSHHPSQWNASNIVAVCVNHPPACPRGLKNKQGHGRSSVWPFTHHPLCLMMPEQWTSHGLRPQRGSVCPLVEPLVKEHVLLCILTGVAVEGGGRTYTLWGNPFTKPPRLWKKEKTRKKKMISLLSGNSKQVPECAFVWCKSARMLCFGVPCYVNRNDTFHKQEMTGSRNRKWAHFWVLSPYSVLYVRVVWHSDES